MSPTPRRPAPATLTISIVAVAATLLVVLAATIPPAAFAGARDSRPTTPTTDSVGIDSAALAPESGRPAGGPSTDAAAAAFDPKKVALSLTLVKGGFSAPVLVTSARDGSGRLFIVEQAGVIRIIKNGSTLATPFLSLKGSITSGGERGLLGLAFHPDFAHHPYIYVDFTDRNGNTAINRYTVSSNPDVVNRASGVRILTIGQPYSNHNGGNLAFGPDGFLYIGMGDGGSGGDPGNRAQSLNSLLGKILRIDIDHGSGGRRYRSPASNPYVGRAGLDEIWARGLRNPWRWSFDRVTGRLWIGDVGQDRYEEIDRALPHPGAPAGRGVNFGWRVMEGRACYNPSSGCSTSGKQPPLAVYAHAVSGADNCAVTGGFEYRGTASPALRGAYVFGDFCSGRIWLLPYGAHTPTTPTLVRDATASPQLAISSFGEDDNGELYVCDLNGGGIYRITASLKP